MHAQIRVSLRVWRYGQRMAVEHEDPRSITPPADAPEESSRPESRPGPSGDPADPPGVERVRLARGGALLFEAEGFRLIEPRGLKRSPLHDYDSITHVYITDRLLLIGTRDRLLTIRIRDFVDEQEGPRRAEQALRERVGALSDGARRLQSIDEVDRLGERDGPPWIIWTLVGLCLVVTALQLNDPQLKEIGAFLPELFGRGEYWRAITAHFLHDLTPSPGPIRALFPSLVVLPIHLMVNVAGMLVLGHLVERPIGSWRTAIVIACSAVGTIAGIVIAGHVNVIGSSGLVAGLAGSMLALELHFSESMPTFWRLPRRLFIAVILVQFLMIDPLFKSYLAGGAHLGGFAGGYLSTWALGRPSLASLEPTPALKLGGYSAALLVGIGFIGALPLARHDMGALERHASRLWNTQDAPYLYQYDNAAAWLIATEEGASEQGLELAVALADRAVASTGRLHPGILDTLAEALFQSGDALGAVLTIEEAIQLQPWEPYFFEQWRRFTGERSPDDRPPPPDYAPPPDGVFDRELLPAPIDPDAPRVTI